MDQTIYKLIIADDDPWIRDGLKKMVQWRNLGFEWSGEAANGAEALALCRELKPDAAIIDISMPIVNGLDFIRQSKEEFPDLKVVIMTCHDEFSYAKQAVSLGCEDYLLKNTSDLAKIGEVARKLHQSIANHKMTVDSRQILKALDRQSDHMLKNEWYGHLLRQNLSDEYLKLFPFANLIQKMQMLSIQIDFDQANGQLLDELKSKLKETFLEDHAEVFLSYTMLHFFIPSQVNPSRLIQVNRAVELAKRIQAVVKQCIPPDSRYLFYILEPFKGFEGLHALNAQFEQMRNTTFYLPSGSVVSWFVPHKYADKLSESERQELIEGLRNTLDHRSLDIDVILRKVEERELDPDEARKCLAESIDRHDRLRDDGGFWKQQLLAAPSWSEAVKTFKRLMEIKEQTKTKSSQVRKEMARAISYIEEHYTSGALSLNQIADHVGLTPNYLGSLFKKETGETVVEYMNRLRIEKAKELVRQNHSLKVYEVAECVGIHDPQYFSRLFKKMVGVSFKKYQLTMA